MLQRAALGQRLTGHQGIFVAYFVMDPSKTLAGQAQELPPSNPVSNRFEGGFRETAVQKNDSAEKDLRSACNGLSFLFNSWRPFPGCECIAAGVCDHHCPKIAGGKKEHRENHAQSTGISYSRPTVAKVLNPE